MRKDVMDECVKCGSTDIRIREKRMEFEVKNPGRISVVQKCMVCQECDSAYFDSKQISELSKKVKTGIHSH